MTTEITLYGRSVKTVFDLLGDKENDITYSLGWAFAHSDYLTYAFLQDLLGRHRISSPDMIRLQEGISGAGFTDIEIIAGEIHVVLEAKRGWTFPTEEQLRKYAERTDAPPTALVVIAEASQAFVRVHKKLPKKIADVPVHYRSWQQVAELAARVSSSRGGHAEKRLLRDLIRYLKGLMTMQNVQDNMVFVVSLGGEIENTGISYRDVVLEHDRYFCPFGKGWPKTPPNYLGFRFDGELQQIRHVDGYEINESDYSGFKPLKGKVKWDHTPHWLFTLGPVIKPEHTVRTGNLYRNQHAWVAIDLLLTSETIAEARNRTKERLEAAGEL